MNKKLDITNEDLLLDYQEVYLRLQKAWLVELSGAVDKKERQEIQKTIKEIGETYLKTKKMLNKQS